MPLKTYELGYDNKFPRREAQNFIIFVNIQAAKTKDVLCYVSWNKTTKPNKYAPEAPKPKLA